MGAGTFVNKTQAKPRATRTVRQGIDWVLIGVVVALTLFGLLMVYSAGPKFALENGLAPDHLITRQLLWAFLGGVAAFLLSRVNYHFFQRISVLMMIGTLLLLVVVALLADTTLGANRSLFLGSVRPSELAKLAAIIYVSVWLNAKREVINDISLGLIPLMILLGLTSGLIMIQPDLSAAITVMLLGGILFFLAGGAWRQIGITIAATSMVGWVVVNVFPTGIQRITDYLAGLNNPLNASYHVQRSLEAIINGGFFGTGIGLSSTKFTGLPVAPTDSIFAVVAEETGMLGAGLVIIGFIILLWRGLGIAERAPDQLGSLLASGITIWIVLEAFLNMAVMVNLLPQAGNALPFISYGGSSLTITLSAIGVLLNIARVSEKSDSQQGGNNFGAVVDLRWRDRRRSVSRFSGPSSTRQGR